MTLKELRELIEIVTSESTIEEFEFERSGVRVRLRRGSVGAHEAQSQPPAPAPGDPLRTSEPPETISADDEGSAASDSGLHEITSPMVGTFYRAPSPDADPFVKAGDTVEKGTVVCIIEAMKLMNEIESDVAGEVVNVGIENGHPVEYGDVLLVVRPR